MNAINKNCVGIFALLLLLLFGRTQQQITALYKAETLKADGSNLLVQNAKPGVPYIFVFPRSARSPGLEVESLALEVRLRLAKTSVPFYLLSNHLLIGSATNGRTPFMQLNGKYIEGADEIFNILTRVVKKEKQEDEEEEAMNSTGKSAFSKKGQEAAADDDDADRKMAVASINDKKKVDQFFRKMRDTTVSKVSEGIDKVTEAIDKAAETKREKKEAEIMKSSQMLFLILLRDSVYRDPAEVQSINDGLKFMSSSDQSVQEELVPMLFAARPLGKVPTIFGKKNANEEHSKRRDEEEEERRRARGKGKAAMGEQRGEEGDKRKKKAKAASAYGEKCLKDLSFWKAYFDVKNSESSDKAKMDFLEAHANCLGDLMIKSQQHHHQSKSPSSRKGASEISEIVEEEVAGIMSSTPEKMVPWVRFDARMGELIDAELHEYFRNEQTGQEKRMHTFLNEKLVDLITKKHFGFVTPQVERRRLLDCTEEEICKLFTEALKPILEQLGERDKQQKIEQKPPFRHTLFRAMNQVTMMDVSPLLQHELQLMEQQQEREHQQQLLAQKPQPPQFLFGPEPSKVDAYLFAVLLQFQELDDLNMKKLRRELFAQTLHKQQLMSDYVKEMQAYLGWTKEGSNHSLMSQRPWPLMYEHERDDIVEHEDKYNGPFSLKTDTLTWLPMYTWDHDERDEAFAHANGGNPKNSELLKFVYHRLDAYLKWNGEMFANFGKCMTHFVASFLCGLEGNEEPGSKVDTTSRAKDCKFWHLGKMKRTFVMEVQVKKVVYNAVVEFNKQLIEQSMVRAVETSIPGDPPRPLGDVH